MVGSGNVATQMAAALDGPAEVCQVYSRNLEHARSLASTLKSAESVSRPEEIDASADFYIISVKDNAVADVIAQLPDRSNGIWLHTSGSVPAEVFEGRRSRYGVIYPLQTFNRTNRLDFRHDVPLLVEGNTPEIAAAVSELAAMISDRVEPADSVRRKIIHRAAVFGCNFANYMWLISERILREGGYDLTLLEPILRTTLKNAMAIGPEKAQSGPARRGDTTIIEAHAALLPEKEAELYRMISSEIMKHYNE